MKNEFITFLKEKKLWNKFCKYIREYKRYTNTPLTSLAYLKYDDIAFGNYQYLLRAFTWDSTPEGDSFWSIIDDEWCKKIKKYNSVN